MDTENMFLALAKKSKNIILEFIAEKELIDETTIKEVFIDENGEAIYIEDIYSGLQVYHLSEISNIFAMSMEGFGQCPATFYSSLNIALSNLNDTYKKMNKNEFIKYAGRLHYMEHRCEELYRKLKDIEREVAELSQ